LTIRQAVINLTATVLPDAIAQRPHPPLRVLAGPGTGKTYALMQGVTALLNAGQSADRILVSTFTRTAAADLRAEIAKISVFGARDIVAGTLHSYCFGLLSRDHVFHHTNRVPRPLLNFEARFMIADLIDFGGLRSREERLEAFNAAWARLQTEEPGWPADPVDQRYQIALTSWLVFHHAILVGEIVPVCLSYLRANPAAPELAAFDHVLVDEYQDLNKAEQSLLDELSKNASLAVIGDPDQSIYSFKYAHPEGILVFPATHVGTLEEGLTICRRCPQTVVRLANALIAHNTVRSTAPIVPRPENEAGEVHIVQWQDMDEEARSVAAFIKRRLDAGQVTAGRVLVLAPRRQFGYLVRNALRAVDVHAHSFFNEEALDGNPRKPGEFDAQKVFTLLTLLARPEDRVALRCWLGFGSGSLHERGWREIRKHCEVTGATPRQALDALVAGTLHLPYTKDLLPGYEELVRRETATAGLVGASLMDTLFPPDADWADPFRAVVEGTDISTFTPADLRPVLEVAITRPELPTDVDYVRVMSLHKSKGLTADLVVVVGCIEGLIPTVNTDHTTAQQDRETEEQRRLFYVALTRTRKTLVLSSVRRLPRDLAHRIGARLPWGITAQGPTIASRFLSELGPAVPTSATNLP